MKPELKTWRDHIYWGCHWKRFFLGVGSYWGTAKLISFYLGPLELTIQFTFNKNHIFKKELEQFREMLKLRRKGH